MEAMRRTSSGEADPPFSMFVARTAFRLHAALFAAVNVPLAVANLTLFPKVLFFPWPLAGWGMGLVLHYLLGVRWADRTRPRTAERSRRQASRRYRHLRLVGPRP